MYTATPDVCDSYAVDAKIAFDCHDVLPRLAFGPRARKVFAPAIQCEEGAESPDAFQRECRVNQNGLWEHVMPEATRLRYFVRDGAGFQ